MHAFPMVSRPLQAHAGTNTCVPVPLLSKGFLAEGSVTVDIPTYPLAGYFTANRYKLSAAPTSHLVLSDDRRDESDRGRENEADCGRGTNWAALTVDLQDPPWLELDLVLEAGRPKLILGWSLALGGPEALLYCYKLAFHVRGWKRTNPAVGLSQRFVSLRDPQRPDLPRAILVDSVRSCDAILRELDCAAELDPGIYLRGSYRS